jgi:hypothetical protein
MIIIEIGDKTQTAHRKTTVTEEKKAEILGKWNSHKGNGASART